VILLLLACAPAPAPAWTPPPLPPGDPCVGWTDPDHVGYCLATSVEYLPWAEAEVRCVLAGTWEDECRDRWVAARLRAIGPVPPGALGSLATTPEQITKADALVAFCRVDDCRFEAVDRFRDPRLANQLARCGVAGRYETSCGSHAVESWQTLPPTAEGTAELWAAMPGLGRDARTRAAVAAGWAWACLELPCPPGPDQGACEQGRRGGRPCP